MRWPLFFMPNAQKGYVSTYIFGDYNITEDMVTMEFMVDYANLVVETEPIRAIAPLVIAGLLGAGASLYGSWKSGKQSADADANAKNAMDAQKAANDAWWAQKQSENYMDTLESQAAIAKARELAAEQMANARGVQAVMGGTDASVAVAQKSANKMLADTISGMAVQQTARKDAAEQMYLNQNNALSNQMINYYSQKSANNAAAGSSALGALGQIGSALITAFGGK